MCPGLSRLGNVTGVTDTNRVEAFSDGVLAIAITLLTLDLAVPARESLGAGSLAAALGRSWPAYAAYVVSFLVIGIIWVNHHAMFRLIDRVDRPTLFANLLLLMVVAAIPFPTRLLAEYLTAGDNDAHAAAAVYSATMLAMGLAFALLWLVATRRQDLLTEGMAVRTARAAAGRFAAGNVVYAATVGLAFVSAPATLAAHFALAVYYCSNQLSQAQPSKVDTG
jgi:uncharacterized membrane protein